MAKARTRIPARRPRIYALLGNRASLRPTSGDQINEARFLSALSVFADVYYNNQKFQPEAPDWGLTATTISPPDKTFDLYYVRNNPAVFQGCPSPKVAMAYPYEPGVFYQADALFVTTEAWKQGLSPYAPNNHLSAPLRPWYGDMSMPLPPLINIKQVLDDHFSTPPVRRDVTEARGRMTFGKAIGFFGRLESNTFPVIFTEAYQELRRTLPELQFVVAGALRIQLPESVLMLPRIGYESMPAYVNACVATASDEGDDAEFLGSGKVLDSVAAGVPIIAYKTGPRIEQLGEDYPLYYRDRQSCARCLMQVVFDSELVKEVRRRLAHRASIFSPAARAEELRVAIEPLLRPKT